MKKFLTWLLSGSIFMLGIPALLRIFVPADMAMGALMTLFFMVNPAYCLVAGGSCGKDVKHLWFVPLLTAVLFLTGVWCFFDFGDPGFLLYAAVYLAIGYAALGISWLVVRLMPKKPHFENED